MSAEDELSQKARALRALDPFEQAARMLGRDPDETNGPVDGLAFTLNLAAQERQRVLLGELDDVHGMSPWDRVIDILGRNEFEVIDVRRVSDDRGPKPATLVAAHQGRSLLLHAYSFIWPSSQEETLSSGSVYGCVDIGDMSLEDYWKNVFDIGFSSSGRWVDKRIPISIDIREGLTSKLNAMERQGFRFIPWNDAVRGQYIHLLSSAEIPHMTPMTETARRNALRAKQVLAKAPEWVKAFMGDIRRTVKT